MIYGSVPIEDEFAGADFGDERLTRRLVKITSDLAPDPALSLPVACDSDAALEGSYRFLGNDRVTTTKILAPHRRRTVERAAAKPFVLVAHDTTELRYSSERADLGRVSNQGHGLFAHVSLVIDGDGTRDPLGVLGLQAYSREPRAEGEARPSEEDQLESWRWWKGVEEVVDSLAGRAVAVHLMDREADSHRLLARLIAGGHRFVIRARHDRRLDVEWPDTPFLMERMLLAEDLAVREATLSARKVVRSRPRSAHLPRSARTATLAISAARVRLRGVERIGARVGARTAPLELNAVRVHERDTPAGCTPVEWVLLTTEPIATIEDLGQVVDAYRSRWVIEEYFKSLKSGCAIEKRQLESHHALANALAVFAPIAWQLLRLRTLGRRDEAKPAEHVLGDLEIKILQRHTRARLTPRHPTVRESMLAIARLGGHIKNNGDPGWMVLGRGLEKLLLLKEGVLLGLSDM